MVVEYLKALEKIGVVEQGEARPLKV